MCSVLPTWFMLIPKWRRNMVSEPIASVLSDYSNNFILRNIIIMQLSRSYSMKLALMHFVQALVSS